MSAHTKQGKPSVIVVGPQGCGKGLNAKALAAAYGLPHWIDADAGITPKYDHLILADMVPSNANGLQVVQFAEAMKKVATPHPLTPPIRFA